MSQEAKPPFVIFETRAVEDRTKSIEEGHYVAKDAVYAIITPAGTKDRIEKLAEDWLHDLADAVKQDRFPAQWLDAYESAFKAWCENRAIPEFGVPITDWPALSPAQVRMLQDIGLRTVEHVAEATEEAVGRMGMGGRALKSKAQAYLDASSDAGKVSAELDAMRQRLQELESRDTEREERLKSLESENAKLKQAEAKK